MKKTTISYLAERYDVLLFDAYGVLVCSGSVLSGAKKMLDSLVAMNKRFYILTNDSSKLPQVGAACYQGYGLPITEAQMITSGSLLTDYFRSHNLKGKRCAVIGPEQSYPYISNSGGIIVDRTDDFEVVVITDESGIPLLQALDEVLSGIYRRYDQDLPVRLVLPNPDLVYPKTEGFGVTSGSLALVLEHAIRMRYPNKPCLFDRLGKPFSPIYEKAVAIAGTRNCVMIGDQMETDIRGAKQFGLDAALVCGGVANEAALSGFEFQPDYILDAF